VPASDDESSVAVNVPVECWPVAVAVLMTLTLQEAPRCLELNVASSPFAV
jgi:hypothetical protein